MDARRPPVRASQVAASIGTGDSTLSAWLHNPSRRPNTEMCQRLADYFHVPVEDVLRAAGHLPPLAEPAPEPDLTPRVLNLAKVLQELSDDDFEAVDHIARGLLATHSPTAPYDQAP